MAEILKRLQFSPTGKLLVSKAVRLWSLKDTDELPSMIRLGTVSRTDAVLVRKLDSDSGEETRERQVVVYVRQGQSMSDAVLDLAHELVHATSRSEWDPYDPDLTAGKYVWNALEGEGGEIDALSTECRVAYELSSSTAAFGGSRCKEYFPSETSPQSSASQMIKRERIRADFYRSGSWYEGVRSELGAEVTLFPELSPESPKFYSSTGHAPYPEALLQEYAIITETACENSRKRISALSQGVASRALAAAERTLGRKRSGAHAQTELFLARRCK